MAVRHVTIKDNMVMLDGQHVPTFSWRLVSGDDPDVPRLYAELPVIDLNADLPTYDGPAHVTYFVTMTEWAEGQGDTVPDALRALADALENPPERP